MYVVNGSVIVDTGPIVAWINRRDTWHAWATEIFAHLSPPLLTCEQVLLEASFLIVRSGGTGTEVLSLLHKEVFKIRFHLEPEAETIARYMKRYRQVPMSLTDACLVRMSELQPRSRLLTIDTDFRIYRRHDRQVIPLLIPPGL
jgi:predicted nucleic acid-binding protein